MAFSSFRKTRKLSEVGIFVHFLGCNAARCDEIVGYGYGLVMVMVFLFSV